MSNQGKPEDSIQSCLLVEAVSFVMRNPESLKRVVHALAIGLALENPADSVMADGSRLDYPSGNHVHDEWLPLFS